MTNENPEDYFWTEDENLDMQKGMRSKGDGAMEANLNEY
jgi:hypothetical protein